MNIVIWVQYGISAELYGTKPQCLLKSAVEALDKPKGSLNIVGVVESVPVNINELETMDKRDLVNIDYDLVLVTGYDVDIAPVLKEAAELGLDTDKFVLDRAVLTPGFTLEKYQALNHSAPSIFSVGWCKGVYSRPKPVRIVGDKEILRGLVS